ncbi:Crp/Fnr family transcriptional regulator [Spirosoma koreense]
MNDIINSLFPSKSIQQTISSKLIKSSYEKGSIIIQSGRINNDLFFLEKGIARGYYYVGNGDNNENEITSWIIAEGNFIAVPHSFFGRKPSVEVVHLLERSSLYSISYDDLEELTRNNPEVAIVKSRLVEQYLVHYEERLRALRSTSAIDRLLFFEEHHKVLLNRVPQKYIASFLGITPQTLSKLRSDRIRKNQ